MILWSALLKGLRGAGRLLLLRRVPGAEACRPEPAADAARGSGGDKYAILPFPGEIPYRCFTGSQK